MSTCPSCGVAVVPGYVKCPKCGKALPMTRRASTAATAGGTAVAREGGFSPLILAGGAGVAVVVVLVLVFSGGKKESAATPTRDDPTDDPTTAASPTEPTNEPIQPTQPTQPTAPDPQVAAGELDRELKRQRLWGTVTVAGSRVDVRSGGCEDPKMAPLLDAASPQLKAAGITDLRCLAQSGSLVFERDL